MIATGLIELGFVPLVDFLVQEADGAETLTWMSTSPQPTQAAIDAAIAVSLQKQTTEAARVRAFRLSQDRIDMLQRLRTATPAQISNYVDNNVAGTTAQQVAAVRAILKAILITIALDART